MRTPTAAALCALLTWAGAAAGEEPPSVDEIVRRHVEARGGSEAMRAIRTLVYSQGTYREGDYVGSGDAFMAFARPYFRVVGDPRKPGAYLEGYDGAAWEWLGDPGIVVRTVGAAAGASRRGADFEGTLVDYRAKGSRVALGPAEDLDGRPVHHLVVTLRDGFVRQLLVDRETWLVVAERRSAPVHAFGDSVTTLTRIGDYRPVAGVLFAHSFVETDEATGDVLNQMQWGKIEAGLDLPASWFSPPDFERSRLQHLLELLYGQRADRRAVMWTYHQLRRDHPEIDARAGIEAVGYQMLKMGDVESAVALLEANAREHPEAASAAFGLGRAWATAGDPTRARREYQRALRLDPEYRRAKSALEALGEAAAAENPLAFLEPFIGSWGMDPGSDVLKSRPEMADDVAFRLAWADPRKKILRFFEGIPDGDHDRRVLENFVTFHPRSGEVVALGYQLRDDYLFESTFRPLEDGYVREYKVTYPEGQEFRRDEDRERGWIRYRDRCRLTGADRLHCVTEQLKAGEWQPWGGAEGYTLVRR